MTHIDLDLDPSNTLEKRVHISASLRHNESPEMRDLQLTMYEAIDLYDKLGKCLEVAFPDLSREVL